MAHFFRSFNNNIPYISILTYNKGAFYVRREDLFANFSTFYRKAFKETLGITVHVYNVMFWMISASFLHKHCMWYANFIQGIGRIPLKVLLATIRNFFPKNKHLLRTYIAQICVIDHLCKNLLRLRRKNLVLTRGFLLYMYLSALSS